jgi:hypothetical protein
MISAVSKSFCCSEISSSPSYSNSADSNDLGEGDVGLPNRSAKLLSRIPLRSRLSLTNRKEVDSR